MRLKTSVLRNKINKDNIEKIVNEFLDYHLTYVKEIEDENMKDFYHYYLTKDLLVFDNEDFSNFFADMTTFHNTIIKKVVYHLMTQDVESLKKMQFSERMIEVLKKDFEMMNARSFEDIILTYYGRFDFLVWPDDDTRMIEYNSETPAAFPESVYSYPCITKFLEINENEFEDINKWMENRLADSLERELDYIVENKSSVTVIFGLPEEGVIDPLHEDYINAKQMTAFLKRKLPVEIDVRMIPVNMLDIDEEDNGNLIFWDANENKHKIDVVWSFYPLEWLFEDEELAQGDFQIWDSYMQGKFRFINRPINLITQNKAFWAYIFEYVLENNILSEREKAIVKRLLPSSSFTPKPNTIKKALLFREGVGVDDNSWMFDNVPSIFQEKIEQQLFTIDTFYDNKELYKNSFSGDGSGYQNGYYTIGAFFGEKWFIGIYTRFCERPVTDDTAYFIPAFLDKRYP